MHWDVCVVVGGGGIQTNWLIERDENLSFAIDLHTSWTSRTGGWGLGDHTMESYYYRQH